MLLNLTESLSLHNMFFHKNPTNPTNPTLYIETAKIKSVSYGRLKCHGRRLWVDRGILRSSKNSRTVNHWKGC